MWRVGLCLVCVLLALSGCLKTLEVQSAASPDTQELPSAGQPRGYDETQAEGFEEPPTPNMFNVNMNLNDP